MDDTRLDEYIDTHEERLVETALDLLAFDTQNPPGETTPIVEYVGRELAALGMDTTQVGGDDAPASSDGFRHSQTPTSCSSGTWILSPSSASSGPSTRSASVTETSSTDGGQPI